jgi:hypothetical protein
MLIANASHDPLDPAPFDHPFQINIIYQRSQMRVWTPPKRSGKSGSPAIGSGPSDEVSVIFFRIW